MIRIQLCGQFAVVVGDQRVDAALPGRRGRLLVAYLAAHRSQVTNRAALLDVLWPNSVPDSAATSLTVLLSKIRAVLAPAEIRGRTSIQLVLPVDAVVDFESAVKALHHAESAVAQQQWPRAWAQALTALVVARRPFVPEFDAPWVEQGQAQIDLFHERALACYAEACLGIGHIELPAAEHAARRLITQSPLSEAGYRLLMRVLSARDETAAALAVYEQLRQLLRTQLGVEPGPGSQEVYQRLLGVRAERAGSGG
jgi:DNA-binding SARP family transcriptional activator